MANRRWDEPNASHYSARYAERKRAAERARDAQPRVPEPCKFPGCVCIRKSGRMHCESHAYAYSRACDELTPETDAGAFLKSWGLG